MIESRQIAKGLGLDMKIGDVEYQGDGNKAIFYYIADERVDFRQLIKDLAVAFHVRIEMKQIGARQEAGRIGGTGPCGRELCCATWMKNFSSVSTNAARFQDISLNPQKLAGMCAKLKCCLNYEVDDYVEAGKQLPGKDIILQTQDGDYHLFKNDILAGLCTYSTDKNIAVNCETITAERAKTIIEMNKRGEKPVSLTHDEGKKAEPKPHIDLAGGDSSRFDKAKTGTYHQQLMLRTNNQLPFLGISVIVEQDIYPVGRKLRKRIDCKLVEQNGHVMGSGISCYQYTFDVDSLQLNEGDSLHMYVMHYMKQENMKGISDVGILISQ